MAFENILLWGLVKGNDRLLILTLRSDLLLQLRVRSHFWLVLLQKSDTGFPAVNQTYGDRLLGD